MADNLTITQGSGTTIGADEISGVKYQRVKIIHGADGSNDGDVSSSNPLPVTVSGTVTTQANNLDIRDLTASDVVTVTGGVGQTADVKVTLDNESVAVTNEGLTELASAINNNKLDINLKTSEVSIGGSTQYTEGDTDTTITGTAVMWEDTSDTLVATSDNKPLPVKVATSLPAGTNAIGKLAANSGVDIGDVDVTSIIPGTGATNLGKAEDAAHSSGDTGVMALAVRKDTSAASSGTSGDYEPLSTDATGKLWVTGTVLENAAHTNGEQLNPNGVRRIDTPASSAGTSGDWATLDASAEGALWTTNTPTTTGGCSIFRSIDLDETEEEIKSTAGNLYGYYVHNKSTSTIYLKFYNATAANVTVGTTTPVLTFPIPAGASANVGFAFPIGFSTAITAAATTGVADSDTGAPATNDVIINVFYK